MTNKIQQIPFDEALPTVLTRLAVGEHVLQIVTPDGPLDVKFTRAAGPDVTNLVVFFHGAADRSGRTPPIFVKLPPLQGPAHILSVADPSLRLSPDLRLAWYAGHKGFDTQAWLKRIIATLRKAIPVTRTVYFGSSGGGFAALVASHGDPGSVAIVGSPQTVFETYSPPITQAYREICWPGTLPDTPLAQLTCTNVGEQLYRKGFANTVIYVQSVGDRPHFERQLLPFLMALRGAPNKSDFILHSDFWGEFGHVLAVDEYLLWMNAALASPTTKSADILLQRHKTRIEVAQAAQPPQPAPNPVSPAKVIMPKKSDAPIADDPATVFAAKDLQLALRLSAWSDQQNS